MPMFLTRDRRSLSAGARLSMMVSCPRDSGSAAACSSLRCVSSLSFLHCKLVEPTLQLQRLTVTSAAAIVDPMAAALCGITATRSRGTAQGPAVRATIEPDIGGATAGELSRISF